MRCDKVLDQLSPFLDEVLENEQAAEVSLHLHGCLKCKREFERLSRVREGLRELKPVTAPDYLRELVEMKIRASCQETWRNRLRAALEYRWSRIRTTETAWYLTRLTGALATVILFIAINASMSPMELGFTNPLAMHLVLSQNQRSQQLGIGVLMNLGMVPVEAQKIPISPSSPKINDLNVVNFGQSAPSTAQDDTVSVVAVVDRKGAAKIQDVLEYPADESLLSAYANMITSSSWRPASKNGRAVDSRLVLTFSRVFVSD